MQNQSAMPMCRKWYLCSRRPGNCKTLWIKWRHRNENRFSIFDLFIRQFAGGCFCFCTGKAAPAAALGCCGCVHCQLGSDRKEHQDSGVPVTDNPCINGVLPKQKKANRASCSVGFLLAYFSALIRSLTTSPARIRPITEGTKATLPGVLRRPG